VILIGADADTIFSCLYQAPQTCARDGYVFALPLLRAIIKKWKMDRLPQLQKKKKKPAGIKGGGGGEEWKTAETTKRRAGHVRGGGEREGEDQNPKKEKHEQRRKGKMRMCT
jgi:hypothetical protein